MFFIGILGIDNKSKEIKTFKNSCCKNCDNCESMKLIKNYSYFHLFFIPLIKWNETYYVLCSKCYSIYKLSLDKGKSIEKGEDVGITYWDLQEINHKHSNVCKNCGANIEDDFKYCPYCGTRKDI